VNCEGNPRKGIASKLLVFVAGHARRMGSRRGQQLPISSDDDLLLQKRVLPACSIGTSILHTPHISSQIHFQLPVQLLHLFLLYTTEATLECREPLQPDPQYIPSASTSTLHLHHKTNSDTMDHSEEPKYNCKCGQVSDLCEPPATTSEDTTSTTDGVRKPSQRVPHTRLDFLLEIALPVFFCLAAACWLHTVHHYVRSVYF
jgi:hypothetical protein